MSSTIYKNFNNNDIIKGLRKKVIYGAFTKDNGNITDNNIEVATNINRIGNFIDVLDKDTKETIFSLAFIQKPSDNDLNSNNLINLTSNKILYRQLYNILYSDNLNGNIKNLDNTNINYGFVILFKKERIKEELDNEVLKIQLSNTLISNTQTFYFRIDKNIKLNFYKETAYAIRFSDSNYNYKQTVQNNVITNYFIAGFLLPKSGIIILNLEAQDDNNNRLFTLLYSGNSRLSTINENTITESNTISYLTILGNSFKYFEARNIETINSISFFVRIKNDEFNYSQNPTYLDSNNNIKNVYFIENPTTYITTIGIYDDENNLLAVAKLNRPLRKDIEREYLIKLKVDF